MWRRLAPALVQPDVDAARPALFAVNAWTRLREGTDAAMVPWPMCHHVLTQGVKLEEKWKKKQEKESRRGAKRKRGEDA